jgi:hypothetical protein
VSASRPDSPVVRNVVVAIVAISSLPPWKSPVLQVDVTVAKVVVSKDIVSVTQKVRSVDPLATVSIAKMGKRKTLIVLKSPRRRV